MPDLVEKIVAVHEALKAADLPHAFGGALALAWCTERARGTIDIDINIFVPFLCPLMAERGKGTILVTSATAAVRGNGGQHSHAAAMAGRRMLCQSLNAEFSIRGIHVAHILIDGAVDAPDTLGKMLGAEKFQELRETRGMEHDGLMLPARIADTYFHLAQQHRSAWTFEIDLRSFSDRPWWNH